MPSVRVEPVEVASHITPHLLARLFKRQSEAYLGPVTGRHGTREKAPYPSSHWNKKRAAQDEYRALGDLGRRSRRTTRDLGMVYHRPIVGQDSCIIKSLDLRLFSPNELSRHDVIVTQFCL